MVILEMIVIINIEEGWILFMIRRSKNTPAVTKVDEWTKAEIGVGAAIAAGNHAENGNWALLEIAAIIKRIKVIFVNSSFVVKFQFIVDVSIAILNKIAISPTRFLRMVIEPEAADL